MLASTAATAGVLTGFTQTTAASRGCADIANHGDEDNFDEWGIDDTYKPEASQDSFSYGATHELTSGLHLIEALPKDNGNYVFHMAASAYGEVTDGECYDGYTSQGVKIKCHDGSLYGAENKNELLVAPEPDGGTSHDVPENLAWSVLVNTFGALNPYASAAAVAADIVRAGVYDLNENSSENNAKEFWWDYSNQNTAHAASHLVDFFVKSRDYTSEVEAVHTMTIDGNLNCDGPGSSGYCRDWMTAETNYKATVHGLGISAADKSDMEELSEDEMDRIGLPEELRDGIIYRTENRGSISGHSVDNSSSKGRRQH